MNREWEYRVCPGCHSTAERRVVVACNIDTTHLTRFAFASRKLPEYMHPRMVECAECGLVYGNPVLGQGNILEGYRQASFDSSLESELAAQTYAGIVSVWLPKLGNLNRALDIGAGDGSFVEQLLNFGFHDVTGIEPSGAPIAQSKMQLRHRLRHDIFRVEDFEPEQFDLITCFQVLEHLWDPAQLMKDAFVLLRRGGMFAVVVHDLHSFSAKLLGPRSPIFDIEHLQLFSRTTITGLLLKSGFADVNVGPIRNRYPVQYWLRLAPLPSLIKASTLRLSKLTHIGGIRCSLRAGNLAAVAWKSGRPND